MSKSVSTRRVLRRTKANNQMLKTTEDASEDQLDGEIEYPRCHKFMELALRLQ